MIGNLHERVLRRVVHEFDRPVIENVVRGKYVEAMVAELLGIGWRMKPDWDAWDIEHDDGTRLEVRQSAARQTWGMPRAGRKPNPSFSIRAPKQVYLGDQSYDCGRRPADIYVFGWHGELEHADQRDAGQWVFFAVKEADLPGQESIGLSGLHRLAQPTGAAALRDVVEGLRACIDQDKRWTPPQGIRLNGTS